VFSSVIFPFNHLEKHETQGDYQVIIPTRAKLCEPSVFGSSAAGIQKSLPERLSHLSHEERSVATKWGNDFCC
jgi:hypothetical protein